MLLIKLSPKLINIFVIEYEVKKHEVFVQQSTSSFDDDDRVGFHNITQ